MSIGIIGVEVHKDAKKENESNIQPSCSNKLSQLSWGKKTCVFAETKQAMLPARVAKQNTELSSACQLDNK